ncbi:response regulator transcription factor [Paenibacillus gansuensis]|uniref:Response regulator n=1 Tax=Paenibacillus gansuensis TaxID=306542 RepID=A0ABW5PFX9_9BACL
MRKVLVVDDEKLVRQGIITTFPWERHGFRIAGEAANGDKALAVLEREQVDLLVTDLAMPGMSGLELIKRVRSLYGDMPVVILTCHDNFKYIQEAMRLGVLDYIVKTELEDDTVEETLVRIAEKLRGEGEEAEAAALGAEKTVESVQQSALLLCARKRGVHPAELVGSTVAAERGAEQKELGLAAWVLVTTAAEAEALLTEAAFRQTGDGWVIVHLTDLPEEMGESEWAAIRRFRSGRLFYEEDAGSSGRLSFAELLLELSKDSAPQPETGTVQLWRDAVWVHEEEAFQRLLRTTRETDLEEAALKSLLYQIALDWDSLLKLPDLQRLVSGLEDVLFWRDAIGWLEGLRAQITQKIHQNASKPIAECIFRAIEALKAQPDLEISESDIAKIANMSRGYFSKCFKKVTGQSYGEYVKLLRLERAKRLLLQTDEPMMRVAERCGFKDYRYFSRVFRDYTGILPNEYRKGTPQMKRGVK